MRIVSTKSKSDISRTPKCDQSLNKVCSNSVTLKAAAKHDLLFKRQAFEGLPSKLAQSRMAYYMAQLSTSRLKIGQ
jgi:hypothetical protein